MFPKDNDVETGRTPAPPSRRAAPSPGAGDAVAPTRRLRTPPGGAGYATKSCFFPTIPGFCMRCS